MPKGEGKVFAQNRQAHHDFHIEDTIEAGMVLTGTEIKSIRRGRINLKDGFARIQRGEVFLHNVHISPFEQGTHFNHEPLRTRKLLLHRKQIKKLQETVQGTGYTLVPLKVYVKNGVAKCLLGVARGKKQYDKREALKQKDIKRDLDRLVKGRK